MKKFFICLVIITMLISTCACSNNSAASDQNITSEVTSENASHDVQSEQTSESDQNADKTESVYNEDVYKLYKEEIDAIISEIDSNLTDHAQNALNKKFCHGDLIDGDGTESKQFTLLFTPDGNNLCVELMRADSEGNLLTVRDDLGLMAGGLTATVRTGLYGEIPALFVVTTNYDSTTRFGTVYVYSLENHDINFVHEESYTGDQEYKSLEEGILAPTSWDICEFKEDGAGQQIDNIKF